jgi:FkbM family methyltransferase
MTAEPQDWRKMRIATLLSASFLHVSHYFAQLPYNLNWQRKNWFALEGLLREHPIHVIDIGARGGIPGELHGLESFTEVVAFDADADEAKRLGSSVHGYRRLTVLPFFVGDSVGPKKFYLYRKRGESSSRLPNRSYLQFSPEFAIEREIMVDSTTLDEIAAAQKLEDVDFLKLDTQGTEYEVLSAATWALARVLMVEVEVEFVEMYLGQKLAFDIQRLMHEKGFECLYVNRVFIGRKAYNGETRGQLIFGDALFGLSLEKALRLPAHKRALYIILLVQYGHIDLAYALFSSSPDLQEKYPHLARLFRPYGGILSKAKRFLLMQLDKVIAIVLHLRKTNQVRMDSDRSWPVR